MTPRFTEREIRLLLDAMYFHKMRPDETGERQRLYDKLARLAGARPHG